MTEEELKKIPFHFTGSMALASEHTCAYSSPDGKLGFCDHTPVKGYMEYGRTYRHYRIGAKIYKSYRKFLEALEQPTPEEQK